MKHVSLYIALIGLLWLPPASAETALGSDLEGLRAYAREHNPELAATRLEAESVMQRSAAADALNDPVLRIEPMDVRRGTPSTKYTLMQKLPWFGTLDLKREQAEAQQAEAQGRVAQSEYALIARLREAYAMHYLAAGSMRLSTASLQLLTQLEHSALARYANGQGTQQDVLRVQLERSATDSELLAWQNETHHAHVQLNVLLSRAVDAPLAEPAALPPVPAPAALDEQALLERLAARNPALRMADANISAAEKERELSYSARYPEFTLGVAPTRSNGAIERWDLMLELNIPLQQGARRANESTAESQLSASKARRQAILEAQRAELVQALSALETARRTETLLANRLLPQAELTYRAALTAYETSQSGFELLIEAHRRLLQAQQQHLKAGVEMQLRLADLEKLLGEAL